MAAEGGPKKGKKAVEQPPPLDVAAARRGLDNMYELLLGLIKEESVTLSAMPKERDQIVDEYLKIEGTLGKLEKARKNGTVAERKRLEAEYRAQFDAFQKQLPETAGEAVSRVQAQENAYYDLNEPEEPMAGEKPPRTPKAPKEVPPKNDAVQAPEAVEAATPSMTEAQIREELDALNLHAKTATGRNHDAIEARAGELEAMLRGAPTPESQAPEAASAATLLYADIKEPTGDFRSSGFGSFSAVPTKTPEAPKGRTLITTERKQPEGGFNTSPEGFFTYGTTAKELPENLKEATPMELTGRLTDSVLTIEASRMEKEKAKENAEKLPESEEEKKERLNTMFSISKMAENSGVAAERNTMMDAEFALKQALGAVQRKRALGQTVNEGELKAVGEARRKYNESRIAYDNAIKKSAKELFEQSPEQGPLREKAQKKFDALVAAGKAPKGPDGKPLTFDQFWVGQKDRYMRVVNYIRNRDAMNRGLELRLDAKKQALGEKAGDLFLKGVQTVGKWNQNLEKKVGKGWARVIKAAASTALLMGVAATSGVFATASVGMILGFGLTKFGNSLLNSAVAGVVGGGLAQALGSGYNWLLNRGRSKAKEKVKTLGLDAKNMTPAELEKYDKERIKLMQKMNKDRIGKKVAIAKALMAIGFGSAVALSLADFTTSAAEGADLTARGAAPDGEAGAGVGAEAAGHADTVAGTGAEAATNSGIEGYPNGLAEAVIDEPGEGADSLFLELKNEMPDNAPPAIKELFENSHQNELSRMLGFATSPEDLAAGQPDEFRVMEMDERIVIDSEKGVVFVDGDGTERILLNPDGTPGQDAEGAMRLYEPGEGAPPPPSAAAPSGGITVTQGEGVPPPPSITVTQGGAVPQGGVPLGPEAGPTAGPVGTQLGGEAPATPAQPGSQAPIGRTLEDIAADASRRQT